MPLQQFALRTLSGTEDHRRLMIFTYHRVLDRQDPLLPNEPTAAGFAKQVGWMSDFLNVLPLPEASQRLATGTLPPRAACITFDDGYRNNFEVALPILQRRRLPATFFIATGALTEGAMWNDLIIESIRHCHGSFSLGRFGFSDYPIHSEPDRVAVIDRALDAMKYLPVDERAARAREIYRTYVGERTPSLMMAPEMLRTLVEHGHDVGGHTVSHPILSKVDDVRAAREIRDCRDWIASATGRAPTSFAYPNGRPGTDFAPRHRKMAREAGFTCAVSTTWGCASPSADPMALPRFTPWEMTRSGFFTRLVKTYVQSYLPSQSGA
jgi:peptidoglycan/xylan/chitin deacetylase (PgdA/CDA1 family)